MWYIWNRIIVVRSRILDYHKYGMDKFFDCAGELKATATSESDFLYETIYACDRKVRSNVNNNISMNWERKSRFRNMRMTRFKQDVIIPITMTIIWVFYIVYSFMLVT